MKSNTKHKFKIILSVIVLVLMGCNDQWNNHNALTKTSLSDNIFKFIKQQPDLSTFTQYLESTGYDKLLATSQTFTVWAPSNEALAQLDQAIVNDSAKLKQFIGNHIAYQEYFTDTPDSSMAVKMLNGKNITIYRDSTSIAGVNITSANNFCGNGVLHILSGTIQSPLNIWDYTIANASKAKQQINYMKTLYAMYFDPLQSVKTGVNSHGEPVYDSVFVQKNKFLMEVNDVSNEDSTYTFFILNDAAWNHEYAKMYPLNQDSDLFNQIDNTKWSVIKDVVVRGKYKRADLPAELVSTDGIKIPVSSITIDGQFEASNGMVYFVSNFDIPLKDKIPVITIEGENYNSVHRANFDYASSAMMAALGIRARSWASGGYDLYIRGDNSGHKEAYLNVLYYTPKLYTTPYKVYWHAVNDFQSGTFQQKLAINADTLTDLTATTYMGQNLVNWVTVSPNNYNEVLLGSFTPYKFDKVRLYVVADKTTTNDPIVLDYIKLEPDTTSFNK